MIRLTLAATAALLLATPALAGDRAKAAEGCAKQHVHTPAGKMVHNAPVYFCKTKAETMAANDKLRTTPLEAKVGRD